MTEEQIKKSILDKIKNDEVKMTPRQFFVMKWLTLSVTSLFFLFLGVYVFAYVGFLFIDNGLVSMPLSTENDLINFIVEIPWTLIVLGIISVFLFSITSKTFYRIYRKPFLIFFFFILGMIVLSHIIFVESGAMNYLKQEAYNNHIKLVPEKFLQFRDSQTGSLFVGYVVSTTSESLIIRDRRNQLVELFGKESMDLNAFTVGQLINAYGQRENNQVIVKSIEIVE